MPQPGRGWNNRSLFLRVLEARNPRSRCWLIGAVPGLPSCLVLPGPSHDREGALVSLLVRPLVPSRGPLTFSSRPDRLPKAPPPGTTLLGGFSSEWRHKHPLQDRHTHTRRALTNFPLRRVSAIWSRSVQQALLSTCWGAGDVRAPAECCSRGPRAPARREEEPADA